MSVSKWSYDATKCDGTYCRGDCDLCDYSEVVDDVDEDKEGGENVTETKF